MKPHQVFPTSQEVGKLILICKTRTTVRLTMQTLEIGEKKEAEGVLRCLFVFNTSISVCTDTLYNYIT